MCSQQCCNGADERSEKSIDRTHFWVSSSRFGSNELGLFHSLSRYKLKFSPDKLCSAMTRVFFLLGFPVELAKIVQDNILYAKAVKLMGNHVNAVKLDFSKILPEDTKTELKEAAVISMGTEVCDLDLIKYQRPLELAGAYLIAHGGSLLNLAKQPGSTVQILGAEKALFRALKTRHATATYGLISHASLIDQAAPKLKGKTS
ncbi:putative nucleolar protein 5-1 [Vitis vinifera]|uniref:Putative nucleolar protein 5-1 n=1 Tax=Vitis vinifera TaxID=29760 RepID=A0A438KLN0_VITVI|nr:putative nucleolar protein 5-1 [Vitis vinifera]